MSKKSDLYFVQSPLQLTSAQKARDNFDANNSVIFLHVQNKVDNNYRQMINGLDGNWGEVHWTHNRLSYLNPFFFFAFLLRIRLEYRGNIERFFYGEFRNCNYAIYESIIEPNESILLDDGSVTIGIQKNYIQEKRCIFEIKDFKSKCFRTTLMKNRTPNLFSFFDLNHYLLPSQINYYKSIKVRPISIVDSFYFVGSKLSEAGFMSQKNELSILKSIFDHSQCDDFYYIPHRGESKEKLVKVESIGYKIKDLNQPLESFYDTTLEMPKKMISYYSTALYTCHLNFGSQVSLVAVDVRKFLTSKVSKINVDTVYDYYSDINITVETIEDYK